MTKSTDDSLTQEVAKLLDEERAVLLSGDLNQIEAMLPRKTELADRLKKADAKQLDELSSLKANALRNQQLLDEAMKGIRNVADRMAELRRVRHQLDTYDAMGQKQVFRTSRKSVERRA